MKPIYELFKADFSQNLTKCVTDRIDFQWTTSMSFSTFNFILFLFTLFIFKFILLILFLPMKYWLLKKQDKGFFSFKNFDYILKKEITCVHERHILLKYVFGVCVFPMEWLCVYFPFFEKHWPLAYTWAHGNMQVISHDCVPIFELGEHFTMLIKISGRCAMTTCKVIFLQRVISSERTAVNSNKPKI